MSASEPPQTGVPQATLATAITSPNPAQPLAERPIVSAPSQLSANCGPKDKATIGVLLETWSSAVVNQNPVRALSIYAEDARLQPLNAKTTLTGRPDIRAHYVREFKVRRALVLAGINARVGCQEAIIVGSYGYATGRLIATASVPGQPAREIKSEEAPFRFVMRLALERGEWLVQEHTLTRMSNDAEHNAKLRYAAGNRPKTADGAALAASPPQGAKGDGGVASHTWASFDLSR